MTFGDFWRPLVPSLLTWPKIWGYYTDLSFQVLSNYISKLDLALLEAELHPGFISLVLRVKFALHGFRNDVITRWPDLTLTWNFVKMYQMDAGNWLMSSAIKMHLFLRLSDPYLPRYEFWPIPNGCYDCVRWRGGRRSHQPALSPPPETRRRLWPPSLPLRPAAVLPAPPLWHIITFQLSGALHWGAGALVCPVCVVGWRVVLD